MILSDKTISDYVEAGKIIILPEFDRKNIRPAGVRLHLGREILIPKDGQTVNLANGEELKFETFDIQEKEFLLKPGQFVLGSTYESFQVPRNIVCYIEGRSTVARLGLAIHCTSGIVDGNYEEPRTVVLEIKNQGVFNIILKFKLALAMVSFTELTTDINQHTQKQYKGQNGTVAPNLKIQQE